ncbi:MAG: DMT family transporter [Proteobacteria bacterium]|nr:DMT family transporter [Pseudomonadota bacterium]
MRSYLAFATWSFLAGVGIPLIGVLNSGISRSVGNPFAATTITFAVAMIVAAAITIPLHGVPTLAQLKAAPAIGYGAGLLIGFYALSATVIIPRFGAASFIAFILIAQLVGSTLIDQFGLFGMTRRPVDILRVSGLIVIVIGIALMEAANLRKASA